MLPTIDSEAVVRDYLKQYGRDPGPEPFDAVLVGKKWVPVETFALWLRRGVAGAVPKAVRVVEPAEV